MQESQAEYLNRMFPFLTERQKDQFVMLDEVYREWNAKINVVSRKDIDNIFEHHILHSLAIGRLILFEKGSRILDVGTGGGFPGIPLAILMPEAEFHLIDRIGKKIKVVNAVKDALGLTNVTAEQKPVEEIKDRYDFITSRAMCGMQDFYKLTSRLVSSRNINKISNGILYLRGDDVETELEGFRHKYTVHNIQDFFPSEFFATKRIVHIPVTNNKPQTKHIKK